MPQNIFQDDRAPLRRRQFDEQRHPDFRQLLIFDRRRIGGDIRMLVQRFSESASVAAHVIDSFVMSDAEDPAP